MSLKYPQEAIIHAIITETSTTKTYQLQPNHDLVYLPGQFLTILLPQKSKNAPLLRRAYSFSSTPGIDVFPALTVKRTENGFVSRKMMDTLQVGDLIHYSHVAGQFTLPNETNYLNQIIFFAAGSGIVPVYSILKTILAFQPHLKVTLIYSSKNKSETIFYKELIQLGDQYKTRFFIQWLFSDNENKSNSRLSHFLLLNILKDLSAKGIRRTLFYLCGPFEYMDMISIILKTEGILPEQIKHEHFFIPRSENPTQPPDKSAQTIAFKLNGKSYSFRSTYPDNILTSALKNKVPLDYSCQSGQCGSCVAKCTRGKVWMQYNEVLTEKELQEGLILTCCGFPVGGAVHLEK